MTILEKLATQGTQDEEKQNKNTEKLATQGTQDEEKQNKHTCVGHHHTQTNTNNLNKTCALPETTGG